MSTPFIGQVILFAGNFAPRGWAFCNGQLLPIAQYTAVFSILGTTYGGNGQTTFGLPDLRGRAAISAGQGPGLSNISLGEMAGTEQVTLTQNEMPMHTHRAMGESATGDQYGPGNNTWGTETAGAAAVYSSATPNTPMNPQAISPAGGSQPFDNRSPYLGLNYIICLEGIYPSRN